MPPVAVLIASSDLLPALEQRAGVTGETQRFSDAQPLEALEAITLYRPALVVLERFFAATPRGAALINRIKADPGCANTEIRVLSHTGDYSRVVVKPNAAAAPPPSAPPPPPAPPAPPAPVPVPAAASAPAPAPTPPPPVPAPAPAAPPPAAPTASQPHPSQAAATPAAPPPGAATATIPTSAPAAAPDAQHTPGSPPAAAPHIDWRGTRRHPRFRLKDGIVAQVEGKEATIVDLSMGGAHVVSASALRPNQKVRVSLPLEPDARLRATVAWASFELPKGSAGPRYRAGLEFNDTDPRIAGFAERNKKD